MFSMDTKIKNYVGIALIAALVLLALSAVFYVKAYNDSIGSDAYRSFGVTAEGKVVAVPDIAAFSFSVVTEGGNDLAALQKANTDKINKAIDYVKKEGGVDEKDIKTSAYQIQPRHQNYNCVSGRVCPPAQIVGYTVSQTVDVKVRDFAKVGSLLSGVVENGANTVSQLQFTLDDPMKAQAEAKGEAIRRAREQAETIAENGGFRLGKLLSVEEGGMGGPIPYASYGKGGGEMMAADTAMVRQAAPAIEPGSQDVTVQVTLRYEIK